MTRNEIQSRAEELSIKHNYLLLTWATRVGKTPAALRIIDKYGGRWNICVAETTHIEQWRQEFIKFGYEKNLDRVNIFCYQSIHKYADNGINWVFDECHHMFGEKRWAVINSINIPKAILLSATVNSNEKEYLTARFELYHEFHISLSRAIEGGILPQPKVFLISIDLDDFIIDYIYTINKGRKDLRKTVTCEFEDRHKHLAAHKHVGLRVRCTALQKYRMLTDDMERKREFYLSIMTEWAKTNWLRIGSERKRFLASVKTNVAKELIATIDGKRFVCFTGSVEQCKELGGKDIVYSAQSTKTNTEVLTAFNEGKINQLYAVGMLREGINLHNIDVGMIIQLDNNSRTFVQRSGRIYLGKEPIQYILYVRGTQDETYLETSLAGFNNEYIYQTTIKNVKEENN